MSDLRRGCFGAVVVLSIFVSIGGGSEQPADYALRCLQALTMMALGFSVAVVLFGKSRA